MARDDLERAVDEDWHVEAKNPVLWRKGSNREISADQRCPMSL